MQSWIHVIEWRATVHPDLPALVDDRGTTLTYAELRTAVDAKEGGWAMIAKCPKSVEFTGPLPRMMAGKALKRELREQGARQ